MLPGGDGIGRAIIGGADDCSAAIGVQFDMARFDEAHRFLEAAVHGRGQRRTGFLTQHG